MGIFEILDKKKNAQQLSEEEIRFFIRGITDGSIPDYQASALLMAICINKMTDEETFILTDAMLHSGETVDLSGIEGVKVDKHSTGGVGDKTSLVLGPMLAACGLKLAKMSGRGLGHTGGTLDKLESFSGLTISLDPDTFIENVNRIGIAIAGQTANIDPADKKLYALRDVTSTVDNVSLISSSIMSKKLASGADTIVLDVKMGSGSFMDTYDKARELAEKMVQIGTKAGRNMCAVISNMDQPLGHAVGNAIEVKEAIASLKGNGPEDLMELCYTLGAEVMIASGFETDKYVARKRMEEVISSGKAFEVFREMVTAQGGDIRQVNDPSLLPTAQYSLNVTAEKDGYVSHINCQQIGIASVHTGAGRRVKEDSVDPAAGIYIYKKVSDRVEKGDVLATVYSSEFDMLDESAQLVREAYSFTDTQQEASPIILEIIQGQ